MDPMAINKPIIFGDILALLERDCTKITLTDGANELHGTADCPLWGPLEDMPVESIGVSGDTLTVWLE